jgi:triphosphatase
VNGLSKHTEVELKLACTDSSVWESIMTAQLLTEVAVPGSEGCQILDARYFDTPTYCLQKAKLAYRIRREGEQWIATVKGGGLSSGGLHERQEWNVIVDDAQPDISVFEKTDIGQHLLAVVGDQTLEPILITRFERKTLDVVMPDGSQIEVAADQGTIMTGSKTAPILEVELELKAGQPSALFQLGAALAREYPLLPEPDSKFYRGLVLAGLVTLQPQKTFKLPQIEKNQLVGEGLRTVLVQLIAEFFASQQTFLEDPKQPEHIHDLRICLRRLRSLLEFAGPLVVEQHKWYQAELRKIGQMLGELREIDVAYAGWKQFADCQTMALDSKISLGAVLEKRRLLEAEKVYGILNSGIATALLLDLWATLTDRKWQQLTEYHVTVGQYTVSRLSGWLKTVMKQGKTIELTNTENIQKLRLQVKKIKYVVEVLQSILYEVPQLMLRLDTLQENLGLLNDYHSTDTLLRKLLKGNSSKALYLEVGMVIGWQGREELFMQSKTNKYWKNFYRTAQRWM